ncbi:Down syndrome cell adhesion molecule-like protein Dscam2, partial [Limulus polyphemus]|uniref:Down syndrome cell adhesion molecule-like protein Dscam2 n=1 Tax=Limulus polyphemus TaxID=6850 RepID=A0ABM1TIH2_LIMPO
MFTVITLIYWLGYYCYVAISLELQGPVFLHEPSQNVDFANSTGAVIPCSAHGKPFPTITWSVNDRTTVSDIPGLRYVRSDGSLVFLPFQAHDFRQNIHDASYRCIASNSVGVIGSREVKVRG